MSTERIRRSWAHCLAAVLVLAGAAPAVGLLVGGCGVDFAYLIPAAAGQINLLLRSVPIKEAIEDGGLTEEQAAKLRLIQDARAYARDVIGLNVRNNYTRFYNSAGRPVAFNVSASRKDAFEPWLWRFPIVGTVPYLGYFNRAAADAKADELASRALDVFVYEIDAYSGLGFVPNLVLSPMLERSDISLVETVFHELLHSTVWRQNATSFNESLATFFGRVGTIKYLADRYPDRPEVIQETFELFEDSDRFSDAMLTLFNDLDSFYSSNLSSNAKVAGREVVYQAARERFATEVQPLMNQPESYDWVGDLPTNNAWMLGFRRYNLDLEVFDLAFTEVGEEWSESLRLFQAATDASDPYAYLRTWLASVMANRLAQKGQARSVDIQGRTGPPFLPRQEVSRGPCPGRLATTILRPEG